MTPAQRLAVIVIGVLTLMVIGAATAPLLPASYAPPAVQTPAR